MKMRLFYSCLIVLLTSTFVLGQLTIRVNDIPANTPIGEDIYVAGDFNDWNPGNSDYILEHLGGEVFEITLSLTPGNLKFKFTRGSWATVEGNANGGFLPDRTYNYSGGADTLELQILSWEGNGSNSTAAPNVSVIAEDFFIPQLNRNRRVWLYLPPDYDVSGTDYPVLYMHDGQNVFDAATSFSGEWEVDESLNQLFENGDAGVIVVAIDNGGSNRLNEYSPWINPNYGGGQGDAYVDFIVETLKPYIDENYRTKPEREFTGIMGSSMGGLISLYAAIEHQDVFSKAGVFSASFWFSTQSYAHVANTGKNADMRIYLIAGLLEDANGGQVADMNAMYNTLLGAGFSEDELVAIGHADGQHSEWYWAREFSDAYLWLYQTNTTGLGEANKHDAHFSVFPNPSDTNFQLLAEGNIRNAEYEVLSMEGKLLMPRKPVEGKLTAIEGLPAGFYLVRAYIDGRLAGTLKLVRQ